MASYRPMTVADLGAHLSGAADGRTRWKLVWSSQTSASRSDLAVTARRAAPCAPGQLR
jgi:hypothetical protein